MLRKNNFRHAAIILLCLVGGLGIPFAADSAETVQVRVNWDYSDSISGVAGFRLYSINNLICETNDAAAREITCEVVVQNQLMPFAMTAYSTTGVESAASGTFWVDFGQATPPPNQSPAAYVTANPVYGVAPLQVHFDGSKSLDPDGTIVAYGWDFSDGDKSAVVSPTHTFAVPGVYTVSLGVTDDKGNTTKAAAMVTVVGASVDSSALQPPSAVIAAQAMKPVDGNDSLMVNFNGTKSTDSDGTILVYRWDFGDGESGDGFEVSHTYGSSGTYEVTLFVVDNDGLVAKAKQKIILSLLPVQPAVVPQDNAAGADGGGGGCSVVRLQGGEGHGGGDWLLSFVFLLAIPLVARMRKSIGNGQ